MLWFLLISAPVSNHPAMFHPDVCRASSLLAAFEQGEKQYAPPHEGEMIWGGGNSSKINAALKKLKANSPQEIVDKLKKRIRR